MISQVGQKRQAQQGAAKGYQVLRGAVGLVRQAHWAGRGHSGSDLNGVLMRAPCTLTPSGMRSLRVEGSLTQQKGIRSIQEGSSCALNIDQGIDPECRDGMRR